jgi:intracellular sulfur oxidation DsrE/DsrF family protein
MTAVTAERTLRPLRHLSWRTTAAGNIAVVVPGAAVAVVLAAQQGRPIVAGVIALVAAGVAAFVIVPALRIRTTLEKDGISTFWTTRIGKARVLRADVRRAVIRTIYNSDGVSTHRHLFLLDAGDHTRYRMNDRWWTDEQLLTVAHHFGVSLESQNLPVHLGEVRRTARHQLHWSERHRVLASVGVVILGAALCLGFAALAGQAL